MQDEHVIWFSQLGMNDVERVGGKNASLGEMISHLADAGVNVPDGFATTADAYRKFLAHDGLADRINAALDALDVEDVDALAETGEKIRNWVIEHPFPPELEDAIRESFDKLAGENKDISVAVRSSATAEDLPDASFAGQQETFLNVTGENLVQRVKECWASLFTQRAI